MCIHVCRVCPLLKFEKTMLMELMLSTTTLLEFMCRCTFFRVRKSCYEMHVIPVKSKDVKLLTTIYELSLIVINSGQPLINKLNTHIPHTLTINRIYRP